MVIAVARQCSLHVVVAAVMAFGAASDSSKDVTGGYLLYDCDPDPRQSTKGTAFAANLSSLLGALPSAAAPSGFASLRSGSGNGTAFARGICFGDGDSPVPEGCHECLTLAVKRVWPCDGNGRAAFWNDGCFLAYSDTNAPASTEDDDGRRWMIFEAYDAVAYPRFYDVGALVELARPLVPRAAGSSASGRMLDAASASLGANGTLHAVAQCAPWNVTAAGCAACLDRSVRDVPDEDRLIGGVGRGVGSVHRYSCNLRFEISAPVPPAMVKGARIRKRIRDNLVVVVVGAVAVIVVVAIIVGGAFFLVKRNRTRNRLNTFLATPRYIQAPPINLHAHNPSHLISWMEGWLPVSALI